MTTMNVKPTKWRLQSIEYAGFGSKPHFILLDESGNFKMVPVEVGIHNLRHLLGLEEE